LTNSGRLFYSYHQVDLGEKERALIASPEKALLELHAIFQFELRL